MHTISFCSLLLVAGRFFVAEAANLPATRATTLNPVHDRSSSSEDSDSPVGLERDSAPVPDGEVI